MTSDPREAASRTPRNGPRTRSSRRRRRWTPTRAPAGNFDELNAAARGAPLRDERARSALRPPCAHGRRGQTARLHGRARSHRCDARVCRVRVLGRRIRGPPLVHRGETPTRRRRQASCTWPRGTCRRTAQPEARRGRRPATPRTLAAGPGRPSAAPAPLAHRLEVEAERRRTPCSAPVASLEARVAVPGRGAPPRRRRSGRPPWSDRSPAARRSWPRPRPPCSRTRAPHLTQTVGLELAGVGYQDELRAAQGEQAGGLRELAVEAGHRPDRDLAGARPQPDHRECGPRRQRLFRNVEAAGVHLGVGERLTPAGVEQGEHVARALGRPLEVRDADGHREVRGQARERADPGVVARDGLRSPVPEVAFSERVACAPELREEGDVRPALGGLAACREATRQACVAVVARAGQLQERDAEIGQAHSRASPSLAGRGSQAVVRRLGLVRRLCRARPA